MFTILRSPFTRPGRWLRDRGLGAWINLAFAGLLAATLYHLLARDTESARNLALYGKRYIAAIALLASSTLLLVTGAIAGRRRFNRVMAVTLTVGFVLTEVALRRMADARLFSASLITPAPYVAFSGTPGYRGERRGFARVMGNRAGEDEIVLNTLGYRGPLPPGDKGDEYRILMVGGSTVFLGSPRSRAIPGRLESLFHEAGLNRVRVYNWGVISVVSGQEVAQIVHRAPDFSPDLVVVYDGWNDVYGPRFYDPRPGYPYNFMVGETARRDFLEGASLTELLIRTAGRSRTLTLALGRRRSQPWRDRDRLRSQCEYGAPEWEREIIDYYARNVERMAAVGSGYGFKVAVFLQPLLAFKAQRIGGEKQLPRDARWGAFVGRMYSRMVGATRDRLARFPEDRVRFVDLSRCLMESTEELFWDGGHVNNRGNELIARQMFTRLMPFVGAISGRRIVASTDPTPSVRRPE